MIANFVILALVTLERLAELWLSSRNTNKLLAQGAAEHARGHYPLIVALHGAWLALLWWLAPWRPVRIVFLAMFLVIELARAWVLTALGERWTTRIITLPHAPLVTRGPYRWLRHPNYAVVVAEIAILPLVFGLWQVALVFTLLNAALLSVRIREEDRALSQAQRG